MCAVEGGPKQWEPRQRETSKLFQYLHLLNDGSWRSKSTRDKNGPPLPNTMRGIEERERAGLGLFQPLGHC